jgi:hypothetical protein
LPFRLIERIPLLIGLILYFVSPLGLFIGTNV